MKKSFIFLPICALSLLASCKFLDKEPLTTIAPTNFFTNAADAEASLTAVYDALQGTGAYGQDLNVMGEMPSDDCTSTNGDVNAMDKIIWVPTTSQVYNVYQQAYVGINRANVVLKYVPTVTMDTARRSQIQGEARFIRGLCYFNLVRAYGGVPLRLTPTESGAQADVNLARSTSDQIYAQVVADLSRAAIQMPTTNANRATKNSANALLARVQLTQRNWAAAQAAAQKVITAGVALNGTFKSLYPAENKGAESLFEIQYAGSADGGNILPDLLLPSPIATYSFTKFNIPTTNLIASADTVNDRRWAFNGIISSGSKVVGRDHVSYIDGKPGAGGSSNDAGPFVYKWTSIGNGFNSADNTYVLRYAEVLLNYAEASNEQNGPSGDALAKLNLVRQRAGLAALTAASTQALTKQSLRNEIDTQRRLEMAFEGERWFDLLRYARQTIADGTATHAVNALDIIQQMRNTRDVNYLLFPIPQYELNTNPLVQQNPGY